MPNKNIQIPNSAIDEIQMNERDWRLGNENLIPFGDLPDTFFVNDNRFQNQNKEGYKVSCTAQATTNAINNSLWIKWDKCTQYSGDSLWDKMIEKKLTYTDGASLINAIITAKELGYLTAYYQTYTKLEILNAIYKTDCVVTGSTKINRSKINNNGLVTNLSTGSGHAFCICGWDKNKKIGEYIGAVWCENSYGKNYQDNGGFWIPFDLLEEAIFPITRKALIVSPFWGKQSKEERYKKYITLKNKYDQNKQ